MEVFTSSKFAVRCLTQVIDKQSELRPHNIRNEYLKLIQVKLQHLEIKKELKERKFTIS